MGKLPPLASWFDGTEDAEAYAAWFRTKVEASLAKLEPSAPHDAVMAEIDALIAQAERQKHAR